MDERKEQDEIKGIFQRAGTTLALSDMGYIRFGAIVDTQTDPLMQELGGGEVVGFPTTRRPRATRAMAWSILGKLPESFMHLLGLDKVLVPVVLRNLIPRCPTCTAIAQRPIRLSAYDVPRQGFIALVIQDGSQEMSLAERCELLGVERAYVGSRVVRLEDVSDEDGAPVLRLISAERMAEEQGAIDEWFARGGGPLTVVHVLNREERGREVGSISGGWRCAACSHGVPAPSVPDLYEPVPCQRCRGEGWLHVEDARLLACEECDGFGSTAAIAQAQLGPVMLRHGSLLTIEDLLDGEFELALDESELFSFLCKVGLGRYPLGTPLALLSTAERVLVATVSARISGIKGLICAIDAPAVGIEESVVERERWTQACDPRVVLFEPKTHASPRELAHASAGGDVELRDICIGSIQCERLSFPAGAASLVLPSSGSGGGILFDEIERRFSRRRKLGHLCNFTDIKRCERVGGRHGECDSILELLGLQSELAQELARSVTARQLGLSAADLDLATTRYGCRECLVSDGSFDREKCQTCGGALYDWRVQHLPIGKRSLGEVMRGSLEETQSALWSHDVVLEVLSKIPRELKSRLSLSSSPASIAPAERRFLAVCATLARVPLDKGRISKHGSRERGSTLVLLEGAFATAGSYQEIVLDLIEGALRAGATVLCSGAPAALESCFRSVIRLYDYRVGTAERLLSRFMDRRLSRWLKIV